MGSCVGCCCCKAKDSNDQPRGQVAAPSQGDTWECFVDGCWKKYSPHDNEKININFSQCPEIQLRFKLSFGDGDVLYSFDFNRMVQINSATGVERKVRPIKDLQWECNCGGTWIPYDASDNRLLNQHFAKNPQGTFKTVLSFDRQRRPYTFDFQRMVQISANNILRPIRSSSPPQQTVAAHNAAALDSALAPPATALPPPARPRPAAYNPYAV
mmetsp:Transcript_81170/g.218239  ORF Transcript_81170/g.218239 Transcript_81170/m.218239 type:complete len:213 (-) Transcript_81170:482-1120(-)